MIKIYGAGKDLVFKTIMNELKELRINIYEDKYLSVIRNVIYNSIINVFKEEFNINIINYSKIFGKIIDISIIKQIKFNDGFILKQDIYKNNLIIKVDSYYNSIRLNTYVKSTISNMLINRKISTSRLVNLIHSIDSIYIRKIIEESIDKIKIGILPIHDCVIISRNNEESIKIIIKNTYKEIYNNKNVIKNITEIFIPYTDENKSYVK
jgi:hypothetical protein